MNFAYNFLTNLNQLKSVLLGQFAEVEDGTINLEVSRHNHSEEVTEERFYKPGGEKVLCRIMYEPNGITYYESEKKEDSQDNPS